MENTGFLLKLLCLVYFSISGSALKCFRCQNSGCENLDKEDDNQQCSGAVCYKHLQTYPDKQLRRGCLVDKNQRGCNSSTLVLFGKEVRSTRCYCISGDFCNSSTTFLPFSPVFLFPIVISFYYYQ